MYLIHSNQFRRERVFAKNPPNNIIRIIGSETTALATANIFTEALTMKAIAHAVIADRSNTNMKIKNLLTSI